MATTGDTSSRFPLIASQPTRHHQLSCQHSPFLSLSLCLQPTLSSFSHSTHSLGVEIESLQHELCFHSSLFLKSGQRNRERPDQTRFYLNQLAICLVVVLYGKEMPAGQTLFSKMSFASALIARKGKSSMTTDKRSISLHGQWLKCHQQRFEALSDELLREASFENQSHDFTPN